MKLHLSNFPVKELSALLSPTNLRSQDEKNILLEVLELQSEEKLTRVHSQYGMYWNVGMAIKL